MRFHVALDSLEKENQVLRFSVIGLLVLSVVLCSGILYASMKDPLIIERACFSRSLTLANAAPTKEEMAGFLEMALRERFNSDSEESRLLTSDQLTARTREQTELSKQKLVQKVFLNQVDITEEGFLNVDADRFISTGDVRTVLRFPLKVEIAKITRTDSNPYGLLLTDVQPLVSNEKTKDKENK